jgi:hypothetical protein
VGLFGWWKDNHPRLVAWQVKDGTRLAVQPPPPGNPFTQTVVRPPYLAPGGIATNDALYTGQGSIGQGYPVDPDPGVVGFVRIFDEVHGGRFYIVESDSAIGPAADPGRSLSHAKIGAEYMLGLRLAPKTKAKGVASDEATEFESDTAHLSARSACRMGRGVTTSPAPG